MKKLLTMLLTLTLAVSMLAACSPKEETKKEEPKQEEAKKEEAKQEEKKEEPKQEEAEAKTATLLSFNASDAYTSLVNQNVKELAAAEGIEVTIQDAQNDLGKQNDQLAVALKKSDIVLIQPVNNDATMDLANKVKEGGKPVVFFNREASNSVEAMAVNNSTFVGTKIEQAGIMQGDIIADIYEKNPEIDKNADGIITYVMFQGEPSNPEAQARTKFSVDRAKELGVPLEILGDIIVANWDTGQAQNALEPILGKDKDAVELVIANNDGMALGAVSALNNAGLNTDINDKENWVPVVGVDAVDTAVESIKNGGMTATVKQDAEGMAKAIVAVAKANLEGKMGADAVSAAGYELGEDGVSIRVPYLPFTAEDAK